MPAPRPDRALDPELVDLVILGAGCGGLSLAARLTSGDGDLHVVVLDPRTALADDRSWRFWHRDHHPLRNIAAHEWSGWTSSAMDGRRATHREPGMNYRYIRGADFYRWALAAIADDDRIELRLAVAAHELAPVVPDDGTVGVRVTTDQGEVLARRVVDTRTRLTRALLYQRFSVVEIEHGGALAAEADSVGTVSTPHPPEPWVRRQLDRIFLQAVRAHPERTAGYFMAIASGVAPRRLLRFLTDRATTGDLASTIASLPLLPFLTQLRDGRA